MPKPSKHRKTLISFHACLKKITVEATLNSELTDHLGYEKHQPRKGKNAQNGYTSKTVICDEGEIEIDTPRDRDGTFEPQLIKKNQTHITGMDEQIIALYAKGLSNQEIVEIFKERYNADVSTNLISRVTDSVKKRVLGWQNRPLDAVYPQTKIQLCIVHLVRNSLKYVSWKDYKAVTADLKQVYQAPN
ncbi:Transposase and inactivated derivatives [[Pasteurella] mairii]|uniref:Mutator family transposase n=1 Tax=[Pasteurella] mairii TaxID=757 RepID=A0A379B6Q0_9PAST|nr:Transposase and inactivated derivatives [[Pasteurella] mairii]